MAENNTIGRELKVARTIAGLTQVQVAAAVGITAPYLSGIETGVYMPSERLARDLKEAAGWTPAIAALIASQDKTQVDGGNA